MFVVVLERLPLTLFKLTPVALAFADATLPSAASSVPFVKLSAVPVPLLMLVSLIVAVPKFEPLMPDAERERKYAGWRDAVSRTLTRRG